MLRDKWVNAQHFQTKCKTASEDLDQPAHPRSLICVFARHSVVAKDPKRLKTDNEDSD